MQRNVFRSTLSFCNVFFRSQTVRSLPKTLVPEKILLQRSLVMRPRKDGFIFVSLSQTKERYLSCLGFFKPSTDVKLVKN